MKIAVGEYFKQSSITLLTILAFMPISSSRVMPGFRAIPEVMMIMSELAVLL